MSIKRQLLPEDIQNLLNTLKSRFEKNAHRHAGIDWKKVQDRLENKHQKLLSLYDMEMSGGEPDVVEYNAEADQFIFFDCSAESPSGRRSLCYDGQALESRKENKPKDNALGMAESMGIEILSETEYRTLQSLGKFDTKTSSWLKTPADIRKLGGAIFGDYRYGNIFVYHNGAESYYAARGFRGSLRV
jgi:hypothetical protein